VRETAYGGKSGLFIGAFSSSYGVTWLSHGRNQGPIRRAAAAKGGQRRMAAVQSARITADAGEAASVLSTQPAAMFVALQPRENP